MLNQFTTNKIIPRPGPTTDPAHLSQVLFWLLHPAGTEFITPESLGWDGDCSTFVLS